MPPNGQHLNSTVTDKNLAYFLCGFFSSSGNNLDRMGSDS